MYGDKGLVPEGEYLLPIGVADVKKQGKDITLVTFGKMLKTVLLAAEELEKMGISAEVIDLRTIRPLDHHTIIESVKKTNRIVVVEETWPFCSIASEITYLVQQHAFDYLDAPVKRITQADTPLPFATQLIDESLPSVAKIIAAVKGALYIA
jgi:pyruvate dehydrogenase E1 component beta subunit